MARVFGGQCAAVRMDALGRRLLRDGRVLLPSTAANGTGGGTLSQETTKHTKSTENIGESSISCFSCVSWLLFQNNPPGPAKYLCDGRIHRVRGGWAVTHLPLVRKGHTMIKKLLFWSALAVGGL